MTDLKPTQTDWDIRRHVYEVFVSQGHAPSHQAIEPPFCTCVRRAKLMNGVKSTGANRAPS